MKDWIAKIDYKLAPLYLFLGFFGEFIAVIVVLGVLVWLV